MIIWQICPPRLSAVASLLWENPQKSSSAVLFVHVSGYLCYLRRKQTVTLLPAPPENVTMLTCEIQKLFHLTKDLLHSFKCWWLSKELVVGWRYWLWKDPFVVCGNWNIRHVTSQQVFRVTTFCMDICFLSLRHWSVTSCTMLCWNSAHVATSRCRNSSVSWHGTWYVCFACSIPQT